MVTVTPGRRQKESGSVLILSLWVLTFLTVMAASLAYRARLELRLAQYPWEQVKQAQDARAALETAAAAWKKSAPGDRLPTLEDGGTVEDEASKININTASRSVLERVFAADPAVARAILAWRGEGPDHGLYENSGYLSRHGPFKQKEELLLVQGMTPELYADIRDTITVYGSGGVNLNTASEHVLAALGMPSALVNKILSYRADHTAGFRRVADVIPQLQTYTRLSEKEIETLTALLQLQLLGVQSDILRLRVGRWTMVAEARSTPPRILAWQEGYR